MTTYNPCVSSCGMAISRDHVRRVALLARLQLSDEEERDVAAQLDQILGYFEVLEKIDTKDIEPTAHIAPMETPFREDAVSTEPATERWLANAPATQGRHFRVPKIIE